MSQTPESLSAPPRTGNPTVDAALAGLADVAELGPAQQLEAIGAAHETISAALRAGDQPAGPGAKEA